MRRGQVHGPIEKQRAKRDRTPLDIPTHGRNAYLRAGCRCDVCTDGNAATIRRQVARRRGEIPPYEPPKPTCGIVSTYNRGCRCGECTEAARVHRAYYRAKARAR